MKRLFLVGDSIRRGYDSLVAQKLAGKAEVLYDDENSRFALYTLRFIADWANIAEGKKVDVVHWNNGLWDALHILKDPLPLTLPEHYRVTIARIYDRIKMCFPEAEIVFALTTPAREELCSVDFYRLNSEIEEFNNIAKEVIAQKGGHINDLYSLIISQPKTVYRDGVHYTDEGYDILANAVVRAVTPLLGI